MADIRGDWNDPNLAEKAKQFFLDNYREQYPDFLRNRKREEKPSSNPTGGGTTFELAVDNYPKEVISEASVRYLLKTHHLLGEMLNRVPPEKVTAEAAAIILVRRAILNIARKFLFRLIAFLMFDSRVTSNKSQVKINGDQVFDFGKDFPLKFETMTLAAILCNVIFSELPINSTFAEELSILSNTIAVFFSTFDNIYDIKAIRKCRIGFEEYLQVFGTTDALAAAENCLRRLKTMYLEITKPKEEPKPAQQDDDKLKAIEAQLAKLTDQVEKNTQSVEKNTYAVEKLDRHQTDFLAKLKQVLNAFVKLFRPGMKTPTRETLVGSLADRYKGLERFKEPHRSQIKAVVDLTYERPIVREFKHKDDFTLAAAAKVVWDKNHEKWDKITGSFETYEQLKSSCYNLREKDYDPFHYAV